MSKNTNASAGEAPVTKGKPRRKWLRVIGGVLAVLAETIVLLVIALYGVMFILAKGPSTTARDLFVMSVRETSAAGWLADIYLTEEEIAQIEFNEVEEYQETDTSLIVIADKEVEEHDGQTGPQPDAWGFVDEDGDGIIVDEVTGAGFCGYMMIVKDPSRVIMGSVPTSFGSKGYKVEEYAAHFDAVAAINAGGFYDPNGTGNGSIPDSLVVYEGKVYYEEFGSSSGFVGIDSNNILHVASAITRKEIQEKDIQYGVCFGPVLVSNGEACDVPTSGVNPRTAIGQRSDGAMLLLVIDGRQVISMGATYQDLVNVMLEYGAVNACNLDGGSSTQMWYNGEYINSCCSLLGSRPIPSSFVVLKEGAAENG